MTCALPRLRRRLRRAAPWRRLAALLAALVTVLSVPAAQRVDQDETETRFFALPMSRDARELAATAQEHLAAGRHGEAIDLLGRLLEEHRAEILPEDWRGGERRSQFAAYPGAAQWALEQILALPVEARELYRARFEPRAARALEQVLRQPRRAGLLAVARRWPGTASARSAWRALGDLEYECGRLEAARLAWERGLELARRQGLEAGPEDERRLAAARQALSAAQGATGATGAAGRAAGLPRSDAQPWRRDLDLAPFVPRNSKGYYGHSLLPVLYQERLLISSSLRVFALDAYTGELEWQAGPPRGWADLSPRTADDLFDGVAWDQVLIAPAAGGNVVVAALQTPFSENDNTQWQGIHIMSAIPERRLFAFDLESGRELWNHAPSLSWDGLRWQWPGEGVPYAERMMVAAPPVVAGSRVLVPCYRMQGRIDYHVACYDLESGRLEWSTQVISGQRERNMFGRSKVEFPASPLTVSGSRVLAQTELGAVAALDLFSGAILWESLYRQTPLPKTNSYNPKFRLQTWRLAAPLVVDGVVLSTPADSEELTAYDLADGRTLWAVSENWLSRLDRKTSHLGYNLLVGADGDTLFLGGAKLAALLKPGGLASPSPFSLSWLQVMPERETPLYAPRPVLTSEALLVPSSSERKAYERRNGERLAQWSGTWNGGTPGNVWVEDGALYSLGSEGASGYFDWPALLQRARLTAERRGDAGALRDAAELFLRRGRIALDQRELGAAREHLLEARDFFARLADRDGPEEVWRTGEIECLRALAGVYALESRTAQALELLDTARALEPVGEDLRDLLLQQDELLRVRPDARRVALLDDLEARCGTLPMPAERWLESQAEWRLGRGDGAAPPIPVGAWVRVERANENTRLGRPGPALADLQRVLSEDGGLELGPGATLRDVALAAITGLLASPAGRAAYEPFEQQARAQLQAALEARDEQALASVAGRFPHSRAAEEARDLRIERALATRDPERVVALVREALEGAPPDPGRRARWLLTLGRALGLGGNRTLEQALIRDLAHAQPELVSDLPGYGKKTLAALVATFGKEEPPEAEAPASFDARVLPSPDDRDNLHEFRGVLRRSSASQEEAPDTLHVYASRAALLAFSSREPGRPTWIRPTDEIVPPQRLALAPGRLFFADEQGLYGLARDGQELWQRLCPGDEPRRVAWQDGLVVLTLQSGRVLGVEAEHGLELWETQLAEIGNWKGPITGPGMALFFSQVHGQTSRARVLDLWTGRVRNEFELEGFDAKSALDEVSWIQDELLVAPSFLSRPSSVRGLSLVDGHALWTRAFGPEEDLHSVARSAGQVYLVTTPPSLGPRGGNGGIYELGTRDGAVRQVVPLRPGERPMGIDAYSTIELPAPYLFTYSVMDGERGIPVRAVHLPYGLLWTWSLPVSADEVYDGRPLPMPAVAESCVAIAFQSPRTNRGNMDETSIVFVDKRSGRQLDSLVLDPRRFGAAREIALHGLGPALFAAALGPSPRGCHLEILETPR